MSTNNLQEINTILLIGICVCITFKKRRQLSAAYTLFVYLFMITFVVESTAFPLAINYCNNSTIYNSFTIIELFLLSRYFNQTVSVLRKYHIGWWIFTGGFIVSLFDNLFWESVFRTNSIALMYEQFSICILAICSFYDLFRKDSEWLRETRFYISATTLVYAASTLLFWTFYPFFHKSMAWGIYLPNLFYYTSYILIFSQYKKLRPS